jgi:integrase
MFDTRTGQRLNDRNLRRLLDTAAKKAGVVGISHDRFRHTLGSVLLDEGRSIPEVSVRLGHRTRRSSRRSTRTRCGT